ncbi:hypothetical protein [Polymorphobacter sp.]|uniref:hypothetical protein n=1 Tax=Polymorphobacter sp. TaxID=1909290 RepID=UPI003F724EC7
MRILDRPGLERGACECRASLQAMRRQLSPDGLAPDWPAPDRPMAVLTAGAAITTKRLCG